MANLIQIRLCGYGGQGMVLAGMILGYAAINDDKWVAGSNFYGAQARGGSAGSEVVVSNHPITYPHVIKADILIALSQTAYDAYIQDVNEQNAFALYDDMIIDPRAIHGVQHIGIPATKKVGASAVITGIVTEKSLISSIQANVGQRFRELNIKALEIGYRVGNDIIRS